MSIATPAPIHVPVAAPRAPAAAAPAHAAALRALVRRGLLDNRRTPLVWGGPLGAMSALVVALYPAIRGTLTEAVDSFSAGLKEAVGITDLGTVEAFLNAEMFSLFLPLAVAYFAIRAIAASISGAEEHGHLDALLATPLARRTLVAGAFATTALLVAAMLLAVGALTAAGAAIVGEPIALGRLAAALAGVWALGLFFAGCATLAAGLLHRAAPVVGTCAGLLGAMYLLDVLGKLADGAGALRLMSAFRYYGTPLLDGLDPAGFAVLVVAGALLAAGGAARYERRDIA